MKRLLLSIKMSMKIKTLAGLLFLLVVALAATFASTRSLPPPTYPQLTALAQSNALTSFSAYNALDPNKPVVLCFFCPCGNCQKTAKRLAALAPRPDPNLIAIFSISPADAKEFVKETGFPGTPLLDATSTVANQYGVTNCPRVFVLKGPKILYQNADGDRPLTKDEWQHITPYLH